MIASLQSLRFIFAIFIFIHHFYFNGVQWSPGGPAGVSFFFILSGFVLSAGYYDKISKAEFSYRIFILRRLVRVYPLHLLGLLFYIIIIGVFIGISRPYALVANLTLLQSWVPLKSFYFSGNAVSWCLSVMIFFYVLFPFIVRIIQSYKRLSLIIFIITLFLYLISVNCVPVEQIHYYVYIFPLTRLIDFLIGIYLYKLYVFIKLRDGISKCNPIMQSLIEITSLIPLIISLFIFNIVPEQYALSSLFWLPISIIIITFSICNRGVLSWLFSKQVLIKCGTISFTFYMIHQLFMIIANKILSVLHLNISDFVKFPIYLILTIALSYILYITIEKPISRRCNSYIK